MNRCSDFPAQTLRQDLRYFDPWNMEVWLGPGRVLILPGDDDRGKTYAPLLVLSVKVLQTRVEKVVCSVRLDNPDSEAAPSQTEILLRVMAALGVDQALSGEELALRTTLEEARDQKVRLITTPPVACYNCVFRRTPENVETFTLIPSVPTTFVSGAVLAAAPPPPAQMPEGFQIGGS